MNGNIQTVDAEFTRPSDTTAYAAGDVICNSTSAPTILEFSVGQRNGATGVILRGTLIDSASEATALSAELWLFDTTITMDNDNAAFTPTDAEMKTLVGVLSFTSRKVGTASDNCEFRSDESNIPFACTSGTRKLYGVLVARNAYTPVSGEVFTVRLKVLQVS